MNPNIRGLKTPDQQHEVKLSQYADDTSLLLCDDASINNTFKCLNHYERASGAKINRDKCKGLWSGSLKHRTDRPLDLDWYNDLLPDPILGTFFGNIDCTQRNLQPRLQKVTNTIAAWNHRELSYKGKALVINGLLTSTLWYTATSSAIPAGIISEIDWPYTASSGTIKLRSQTEIFWPSPPLKEDLTFIKYTGKSKLFASIHYGVSLTPHLLTGNSSHNISSASLTRTSEN